MGCKPDPEYFYAGDRISMSSWYCQPGRHYPMVNDTAWNLSPDEYSQNELFVPLKFIYKFNTKAGQLEPNPITVRFSDVQRK